MPGQRLIIATRGSQLALEQARRVQANLASEAQIHVVKTSGDRLQDQPLSQANQVGFFTKEIEQALLDKTAQLAVHSLKDLPTSLAPGLYLGAVLERDEEADILLVRPDRIDENGPLPVQAGARIGASSLRRQALLRTHQPNLLATPIRGNVPTRIKKAVAGEVDAILLSRAGLVRLGIDPAPLVAYDLNPQLWTGAPGQGVIAIECREDDGATRSELQAIDHQMTRQCTGLERKLLSIFEGGCHAPFGAYARMDQTGCHLVVGAALDDGRFRMTWIDAPTEIEALASGERWIREGCPPGTAPQEAWLWRSARPWC